MDLNNAKLEGYRVIGIKDTDKEKLRSHMAESSFEVEVEPEKEVVTPVVETAKAEEAPAVIPASEPAVDVEPEVNTLEAPATQSAVVDVAPSVDAQVSEPAPSEDVNIFDRIAESTPVAEPAVETPVVEQPVETPAPVAPEAPSVPEEVSPIEVASTPEPQTEADTLSTPQQFYENMNNPVVPETPEVPSAPEKVDTKLDSVEPNKPLEQSSTASDALEALKALIDENTVLKAQISELTEKLKVAEARTQAAEMALNGAIQSETRTLN